MKWTECAIEDLQKYEGLKASIKNISERIETLEMKFTGVKGNQTDRNPVSGSGGNHWEDFMIDNISERERLKLLLIINKKIVNTINRGLSTLSEEERLTLEYFYVYMESNHVEKLKEKLHVEKTEVYRLKDKALRKFVLNMFGLPDYLT